MKQATITSFFGLICKFSTISSYFPINRLALMLAAKRTFTVQGISKPSWNKRGLRQLVEEMCRYVCSFVKKRLCSTGIHKCACIYVCIFKTKNKDNSTFPLLSTFQLLHYMYIYNLKSISVVEKLKNSIFEIPVIRQSLNMNNQRTKSAKPINLDIIRKLIKYSFKNNVYSHRF